MIVCFGVAWPINLYNSFKNHSTKGKNLVFMSFIVLAYVFGILNKMFVSVDGAVYFYLLNETMVLADFVLYFVNRRKEIRQGICRSYLQVLR